MSSSGSTPGRRIFRGPSTSDQLAVSLALSEEMHHETVLPFLKTICDDLYERGVIVDYRPPDVIRMCSAPLYVGYENVRDVVDILRAMEREG